MGALLGDRYEPLEVVGRGGQGFVVRARDLRHDRLVALKVRRVGAHEDRGAILAEARLLLGLTPHRGVAIAREDFFDGDRYCLVMDWVEGASLERLLMRDGHPGLPAHEVLSFLAEAAAALDHLHSHSPPIVHRDVKPANLILTGDGGIVLVDFGISVHSDGRKLDRAGTVGYAAPELALGDASVASDVYGLAATALALLTGQAADQAHRKRRGPPDPEFQVLEGVVRRGLATDPARRPGSAGEFVERLRNARQAVLPQGPVTVLRIEIDDSTRRWERHPAAMAEAVERYGALVAEHVDRWGGRLVPGWVTGDERAAVFRSPVAAQTCVRVIEDALGAEPWPADAIIRVRTELSTGTVEHVGGDYRFRLATAPAPVPRRPRASAASRDVAETRDLLATARLVTLIGPAGCGKSRLAAAVAAEIRDERPDAIALVALGALREPEEVADAVARAVDVRALQGPATIDDLEDRLRDRRILLVLDNCDYAIDACARLAERLLTRCRGVGVLATSREPLGVPGEVVRTV